MCLWSGPRLEIWGTPHPYRAPIYGLIDCPSLRRTGPLRISWPSPPNIRTIYSRHPSARQQSQLTSSQSTPPGKVKGEADKTPDRSFGHSCLGRTLIRRYVNYRRMITAAEIASEALSMASNDYHDLDPSCHRIPVHGARLRSWLVL